MTTLRLFLLSPPVVFAARVNMPGTVVYPLDELVYDTVTTGIDSAIFTGTTLLLGTTAGGDDLGRQRVRAVATSTVIPVGRSSRGTHDGELDVIDNAYITILHDFRVWAKIPLFETDGIIYKDSDLTATGPVMFPPPLANAGPGMAGTIDAASGLLTVDFDGGDSFQFDPAASGALMGVASYLWNVDDGTITVGTETSEAITATFPAGFRWVMLTVVSDDARTHQARVPVYARDPDDDDSIGAFQISGHRWDKYGTEIAVRILADIPRSTYPDGTLAMIWDDSNPPPPLTFRSHMIFVGWVQSEDGEIDAQRTATLRDTTLHLVDVAGRLKTLPGFPQVVEATASPDEWSETRFPNVLYYLWYLPYWHSTALDLADLILGTQTLNNFEFKILSSDADSLFNQANSLANNVTPDHHLTCNRFGQLTLVVDPILQYVPDRVATVYQVLTDADWTSIDFGYQRAPRVHQLRSYAISGGDTSIIPLASLAPGEARGQGLQYIESSERITFSQFDLNNVEGNRYARLNAPFGQFQIVVPHAKLFAGFDPARMGWIQLTISAANHPQRTLPFTTARGLVHEATIAYDYQRTGLVRTATLSWEMETSGPPAQTLVLEDEEGA